MNAEVAGPRAELARMIKRFLSGEDRSLAHVNRMEGLLVDRFIDTPLYEELSPPLAMYRPGGGDHLYNEEELAGELRYILQRYLADVDTE